MTDKDWKEDLANENGDYLCKCSSCGGQFRGHKRRVTCKACAIPSTDKERVDADTVRDLLEYNHKDGLLRWKPRPIKYCCSQRYKKAFDTKHAGNIAGKMHRHGYYKINIFRKEYFLHIIAWVHYYGAYPKHAIDHIDGNIKNNAIENLRDVPHSLNMKNLALYKNNTSGRVGVTFEKKSKKWTAYIRSEGVFRNLGHFDKKEDAIKAREVAERKYDFHKNHGRAKI